MRKTYRTARNVFAVVGIFGTALFAVGIYATWDDERRARATTAGELGYVRSVLDHPTSSSTRKRANR